MITPLTNQREKLLTCIFYSFGGAGFEGETEDLVEGRFNGGSSTILIAMLVSFFIALFPMVL
jgi:hypothetical protein